MTNLTRSALLANIDARADEARESFLADQISFAELIEITAFLDEQTAALEALPESAFRADSSVEVESAEAPIGVFGTARECDRAELSLEADFRSGRITARELVRRRAPIRAAAECFSVA